MDQRFVPSLRRHPPFGGVKSSGIGREECVEALLSFTETKAVHVVYDAES